MVNITLRLPKELHEELVRIAEQEDRSMHGQILHYVNQAVRKEHAEKNELQGKKFIRTNVR